MSAERANHKGSKTGLGMAILLLPERAYEASLESPADGHSGPRSYGRRPDRLLRGASHFNLVGLRLRMTLLSSPRPIPGPLALVLQEVNEGDEVLAPACRRAVPMILRPSDNGHYRLCGAA